MVGCGEEQTTAKATARTGEGVRSPTVARSGGLRMGHPDVLGGLENRQRQGQKQRRDRLSLYTSHPSPSAAKDGHPSVFWLVEENKQRQKRNAGVSPLRCAPVEMTAFFGRCGGEQATRGGLRKGSLVPEAETELGGGFAVAGQAEGAEVVEVALASSFGYGEDVVGVPEGAASGDGFHAVDA